MGGCPNPIIIQMADSIISELIDTFSVGHKARTPLLQVDISQNSKKHKFALWRLPPGLCNVLAQSHVVSEGEFINSVSSHMKEQ